MCIRDRIQSHLGSTIAMAFDECVENPATREYAAQSCRRTVRWLYRCKAEMERLNAREAVSYTHLLPHQEGAVRDRRFSGNIP